MAVRAVEVASQAPPPTSEAEKNHKTIMESAVRSIALLPTQASTQTDQEVSLSLTMHTPPCTLAGSVAPPLQRHVCKTRRGLHAWRTRGLSTSLRRQAWAAFLARVAHLVLADVNAGEANVDAPEVAPPPPSEPEP